MFVSIVCEDKRLNKLSGRYNFHSIKNKAVAYVRDGEKVEYFDSYPYYLCYEQNRWRIQGANRFKSKDENERCWIRLKTQGLY